jgi:hypothetical protein
MPQFRPSILITDAYGSAGDVTWYHRNGKCYTRKRSHPAYRGTAGQLEHLDVHRRALAAWRSISHQTQLVWNALAEDVEPHRPPFDHKANISGQNLFVSAYHGFYTLGNEHLPVPRAFDNFPPYSIDLRNAHVESGTLVIPAVVVLGGEENPGRYRLLAKLQLTTPGKGCHPGMLRNYLADASCDSSVVYIRVPDYASIIGNGSNTCQVHGRFILLDNVTGYRSQYQQKSFLLQIAQ